MRWVAALFRVLGRMLAEMVRALRWCLYGVALILGKPVCVLAICALIVIIRGPPTERSVNDDILALVIFLGMPAMLSHQYGHLLRPGARRVRALVIAAKPPPPPPVAAVAARGGDDPNEAQIIGRLPQKLRSMLAK